MYYSIKVTRMGLQEKYVHNISVYAFLVHLKIMINLVKVTKKRFLRKNDLQKVTLHCALTYNSKLISTQYYFVSTVSGNSSLCSKWPACCCLKSLVVLCKISMLSQPNTQKWQNPFLHPHMLINFVISTMFAETA